MVANISDFVFSNFVDFGNSARIVTMVFDDTSDTLYWTDLVKGTLSMSNRNEPMALDVRMYKMGWANWTVISADIAGIIPHNFLFSQNILLYLKT